MTVMEGTLSKWTNVVKGWQYRWFVLDDNSGLLTYYTSKEKMMRGARRGCVCLKGAAIGIDDEDDSAFTVTVDHNKTFHFQARDAEEREKWVRALEETIFRHAKNNRVSNTVLGANPTTSILLTQDLDNKVAEADVYLQLMIDQTQKLDNRLQSSVITQDDRIKYQLIIQYAKAMLESIKHSIVLLQIAKNTAHPINGMSHVVHQASVTTTVPLLVIGDRQKKESKIQSTITNLIPINSTVPEELQNSTDPLIHHALSYSSSEGEEDFFDARDSPYLPASQTPTTSYRSFDELPPPASVPKSNIPKSEDIDYDLLYEDDDELDLVAIENHGSVIKHLLSQVKIGMDLTKVVLPTFILERRSLLEMYADYFAHPDLFLRIVDLENPRDRMVQVVRWYLSAYHAGRRSAVAKKPYNPILGEVFRCHWDFTTPTKTTTTTTTNGDDSTKTTNPIWNNNETEEKMKSSGDEGSTTPTKLNEGPVPWCQKNQLSFIAEQVSHHPPISAFYAEHYDKRITFNAHVYTKSKFLGLSVCVYNIGYGVVTLLDHNETYTVTFPNGYGRSILTVPWIELGGTVTIHCEQTGYSCNVEFLTKPFYGTKKHRINAELYEPDDGKKPFLTVHGEWNGVMEAKWTHSDKTEEFIDVNRLPIIAKNVRPIAEQETNESRYLWKEVTAGLKFNDIEKATTAKQYLEQRQRDLAKERKQNCIEWQTKHFTKFGDDPNAMSWLYKHQLRDRIVNRHHHPITK